MISNYGAVSADVLSEGESFWDRQDFPTDTHELLRYSFFLGLFPFAGFFFSYTVTGRVWNDWPFINSTLPVLRGLMCAGAQWVFFATFPIISTLLLELLYSRRPSPPDAKKLTVVCTYSMVPMHLAALFVGVLFVHRTTTLFGFSIFLYLLYFGYRRYMNLNSRRSAIMTFLVFVLFGLIRYMFVFVIGF